MYALASALGGGCASREAAGEGPPSGDSARAGTRRTVDENGDSVWISADGDTVHSRDPDDPGYLRARQDAQCSLNDFVRRLADPPRTQSELAFKAAIDDSLEVEHVWFQALSAIGDSAVRGEVESAAVLVRGVERGDTLVVPLREIEDWMAVDRDTVVAGFSMRLYRDRLNRDQRARYDSATGYRFGPDAENWRTLAAGCPGGRLRALSDP